MSEPQEPTGRDRFPRPSLPGRRRPTGPAADDPAAAPSPAPPMRRPTEPAPRPGRATPPAASLATRIAATPGFPDVPSLVYADLPPRIVAFLLDLVAIGLIGVVAASTVGALLGGVLRDSITAANEIDPVALVVVLALHLAGSAAYAIVGWSRLERTVGPAIVGLQVVDEAEAGIVTTAEAARRWVIVGIPATLVTVILYLPVLVGWIAAAGGAILLFLLVVSIVRDPVGQGYHDRVAGTVVVKSSRRAG